MQALMVHSSQEIYKAVVATDSHEPNFRGRITSLPLPGTRQFERISGRAGNAVVIQVKSAIGKRGRHKASLASLGLHGIDTAALVDNSLDSTRGSIHALGDFVRVIEFKHRVWKAGKFPARTGDGRIMVEHIKYGSSQNPGNLLRVDGNQYWYSELSKRAVSMAWSTEGSAIEIITSIIKNLGTNTGSGRVIRHTESGEEIGEGTVIEVTQSLEESEPSTIEYVHICIAGLSISWKEPFRRFVDSEIDFSEITVSIPRKDAPRREDILSDIIAMTATKAIKAIKPISTIKRSQ